MSLTKVPSEPTIRDEDYQVARNGVGDTGFAKRTLQGPMSKDDGKHSSNMNRIIKQAEKVPGPGKYVAHEEWQMGHANKFSKEGRDYKTWATGPAPHQYERTDIFLNPSNGAKDVQSNRRRVLDTKISNGKRRSMTDAAIKQAAKTPGPGAYESSKGQSLARSVTSWKQEAAQTVSRNPRKPAEPGPGHFDINYSKSSSETCMPVHAVPKAKGNNFIDKFVKEKWSDVKTKKELPGPGTYNTADFDYMKVSRGTMHLQMRGLTRSAMSGYF
mmetsp:Transcript_57856/g.152308  ORF Transcript_57856/g.152308 Transcript_57856/m.152308 type:complete len:271 (-) Transcript_57856:88-900(-)